MKQLTNDSIARLFGVLSSRVERLLVNGGISNKVDDSSQTVGRRYARTDECGIPFAVTVDQITCQDDTVTVRELHSMKQIRLPVPDMVTLLQDLVATRLVWEQAVERYGIYTPESTE